MNRHFADILKTAISFRPFFYTPPGEIYIVLRGTDLLSDSRNESPTEAT
jgi:hypothetical protein